MKTRSILLAALLSFLLCALPALTGAEEAALRPEIVKTEWDSGRKTFRVYWDNGGDPGRTYLLAGRGGNWTVLVELPAGAEPPEDGYPVPNGLFLPGETYELAALHPDTGALSLPAEVLVPAEISSPLTLQSADISVCGPAGLQALFSEFRALPSWEEREDLVRETESVRASLTFAPEAFENGNVAELRVFIVSPSGAAFTDSVPPSFFDGSTADCSFSVFSAVAAPLLKQGAAESGTYTMEIFDWTHMAYVDSVTFEVPGE